MAANEFKDMNAVALDLCVASDRLALADPARTALPNHVLYELAEAIDKACGLNLRFQADFGGGILDASLSLARQFQSRSMIEPSGSGDLATAFNVISARMLKSMLAFTPEYPGWYPANQP